MGKNKKVDIWACYNCNRWATDDRCQICNAENICCNEDMKVVEPEDQPIIKRKFNEIDEDQIFNEAYNFNNKKRNKIDSFKDYDVVKPDCEKVEAENICINEHMNEDNKENDISDVRCVNGNFIIHKEGCICCRRMANGVSEYTSTVTEQSYNIDGIILAKQTIVYTL